MACKNCSEIKNFKDFYPKNKSICKECIKKRTIVWMKNNPQKLRKSQTKYKANPDNKKRQAEYYRKWYAKNGRERAENYKEINRLWRESNPEKCKARSKVLVAIRSGKLKTPKYCSQCGEKRKLNAHHDDYKFPLKIRWLCYSCHKREHNNLKKLDTNLINSIF